MCPAFVHIADDIFYGRVFDSEASMFQTDTIAAIATALSDSGIGIVRISGTDALSVADTVFRTKSGRQKLMTVESHTIHYGYIVDHEKVIDEVMVAVLRAPRSYTREDTVEINCHGGILVLKRVLESVISHGARLAEPGEFTKRAFLNGRIDLSKAEAVMDVIHSQNEYALQSSMNQLQGKLSEKVRVLREQILYEIAFIESALDDPEHISLEGYPEKLSEKIRNIKFEVEQLLATADKGKMIKEGISAVIVGKPNAGKSSLLNLLVGDERAIVTDIAGTTRDVLQESVKLHGISLNLIDTAGIRDTKNVVERIGVERAKKYAANADLILYVVDTSVKLDESDREIMSLINDKNTIVLLNKTDLDGIVEENDLRNLIENRNPNHGKIIFIRTSTKSDKDNQGMDLLEQSIKDLFFEGFLQSNHEVVITNLRHKEALQNTYNSLSMVLKSIEDEMPEDFYSIDLMSAYASLGLIIGEKVEDDLVEKIFSEFCMGK